MSEKKDAQGHQVEASVGRPAEFVEWAQDWIIDNPRAAWALSYCLVLTMAALAVWFG